MGFGGIVIPDYRGSDHSRGYAFPLPYLIYRGDQLKIDENGGRFNFLRTPRTRVGISVNAGVPVNSDKVEARIGMPDLDPTLEMGPELEHLLMRTASGNELKLQLPLRYAIASDLKHVDGLGWITVPTLQWNLKRKWDTSFSVGLMFASKQYHDYFYGVAPQYATPQRPAYSSDSGYSGTRITIATSRQFRNRWFIAFVRYENLRNAVIEDSPLVKQKYSLMAGFGVAWTLKTSRQYVETRRGF